MGFVQDPSPDPAWVLFARKYFKPVHRKRIHSRSTTVATDPAGNEIWIVGEREMTKQELMSRVRDIAISEIRPSWGIVTEHEKNKLINCQLREID